LLRGLPRTVRHRRYSVLPAAISLTLVAFLAWKTGAGLHVVADRLWAANWGIVGGTMVFSAAWHLGMGAHKWWRILRAQGAPVGYWEVLRVRAGADPIRFAAPMQVGALVSSLYFGKMESLGFSRAAGSVLFDKALNLFGAICWLYAGVMVAGWMPMTWGIGFHTCIGGAVLVLIGCRPARRLILLRAGKLHAKVGRLAAGILSVFEELSPSRKIGFLVYAIVFQVRPLVVCALLFVAFHGEGALLPSVRQFLAFGSVVMVMSNVPSIGGVGPREATLIQVFTDFGDPQTLFSIGICLSFVLQVFPAMVGIPLMFPLLRALTPSGAVEADSG